MSNHAFTNISALAFEAEYGLCGDSGVSSRKNASGSSRGSEPYTSSVETCRYIWSPKSPHPSSHAAFAVLRSATVPITLVSAKAPGSSMERSTWLSAAKFTTYVGAYFSKRRARAARSRISTCSNTRRLSCS